MPKMKCYVVEDPYAYELGTTTVFAENPAKAKYMAYGKDDMGDPEATNEFIRYKVRRLPEGDCRWKEGKYELDYFDPEDRKILARKLGWICGDSAWPDTNTEICNGCEYKETCLAYDLYKEGQDD